jgi:hypothetical protein
MRALLLPLLLAALPAAAQEAPVAWLGPEPHLAMAGTIAGQPVALSVTPETEGVARLAAKREYRPGAGGAWRYADFEVALHAVVEGVERSYEIEIENRDFAAHPLPATFDLGPESFPEGLRAFLEMQQEWETEAGSVNDELGGWTGTLTLLRDEGMRDAEGVAADGLIGGFLLAERGEDRIAVSFAVPVTEAEKDD